MTSKPRVKFRYIVRTFVEASSPQEDLKLAKSLEPHECYIDDKVWAIDDYNLTGESKTKNMGFNKPKE